MADGCSTNKIIDKQLSILERTANYYTSDTRNVEHAGSTVCVYEPENNKRGCAVMNLLTNKEREIALNAYEGCDAYAYVVDDEREIDFERRMNSYEKSLKSYNEWYDKNSEKIAERKAQEKQVKEVKRKNKIADLERQLRKLKNEKTS
jgi:hypothetical protein